ncbi:hypothetical protein DMC30DRAFT_419319 [Rhodotorula diobovata]|uniref:Rad60/SUMO-like domain-containing protein n=1 Tax=Rhodotorula diobovata TaxID=5288 RepID=A0A5C5FMC0_9BASI|nr:hypothetical protein DMC30DRAFT_419319 [Rhodotorula diobovata]
MSSSSELEVLPVSRKPASPPKPRRSGRERRAPRSVDEVALAAAPVARAASGNKSRVLIEPFDTMDAELGPAARELDEVMSHKGLPPMKPSKVVQPIEQAPAASSSRVQLSSSPLAASAPAKLPPSTTSTSTLAASPAPKPASLRRSRTPGDRASTAPRAAPPPHKVSYSSDEADDFFGARKPQPQVKPHVPAAAAGRARLPSRASSGSATPRPTSPVKRALELSSSSSSDSDSSARRDAAALSDSDDGTTTKLTKSLKLPAWALRGSAVSGADRNRLAKGVGRNRKRKKLGESGSEAEGDAGGMAGASEADRGNGKGKGKEKEGRGLLSLSDEDDTDDSLELALVSGAKPSPARQRPAANRLARASSSSSSEQEPAPPRVRSPRKASQQDGLGASLSAAPAASLSTSPYRSPRRPQPSPAAAPVLPSSSPQRGSHLSLSSTSDQGQRGVITLDDYDLDEEDDEPLDATLAAIRSSYAAVRRGDASSTSASASASRGAANLSLSPSKKKHESGELRPGLGAGDKVTVRLRMVFDPTRPAPEVAKRAYEREEVIEMGLHEPFASLFYEVSQRRSLARAELVITHVRDPSVGSASGPAGGTKQTQLYEFGTPASLGLGAGEDAHMRGYVAAVWDKGADVEVASRGGSKAGPAHGDDDDDDPSAAGGLFRLTLRGSRTQSLSLAVKPSTTMSQLARAFCRHFSVPPAAAARLVVEFDGERLEGAMTLGAARDEFDLEGEETFELREVGGGGA